MQARVGFHVSIAGSLPQVVQRALDRGCTTFQSFAGNPRGWALRARAQPEIDAFRRARAAADLTPFFVHACYLVNVCAHDRTVFDRSRRRLAQELSLAAALGADGYVLHPGSHKGRPADWGVRRAASAIVRCLEQTGNAPPLLLENMAAPHGPGGDMHTLGRLVQALRDALPDADVGIALDSCHAFGAGYDLRDAEEVDRLMHDVRREIGVGAPRLLHLNDALDEPGSRRDRHAHVGQGAIGRAGLRNLLSHPAAAGVPLILETPWEGVEADQRNLRAVRAILDETA
ncbi:MAG: deoxyribonuclease IV [Candidatus Brocadiaceae bacterium]|nr:deoxyribonuclease IV [Candidatus Brocadiaceae bacterium]